MSSNPNLRHLNIVFTISCIIGFTLLLFLDPNCYDQLSREDHIAEYLSALFLFLSGLVLLNLSFQYYNDSFSDKSKLITILLPTVSLILIIASGEEISWGQRILNIATPEILMDINGQQELNFHNIDKKFFDRVLDRSIISFVIIATFFLLGNKRQIAKIVLPNTSIICAFFLIPFYHQYNTFSFNFYHLMYLAIALLIYISVKNKDYNSLIIIIGSIVISLLLPHIHYQNNDLFASHNNSANEYREFIFSINTFLFALYMNREFKNRKRSITVP